ncbi:AI-2E family transporter [Candidatus Woesebacteria bacterium]|nr:AI-2E family transporter [Candidatus Woesebacteria bacterium]
MLALFSPNKHSVTIAPSSILAVIGLVLATYFVYQIRSILVLLLLAYIIMVGLLPVVHFFEKKLRLPRGVSMFFAYLLLIVGLVVLIGFLVPPLASEAYQLVKSMNIQIADIPIVQGLQQFSFTVQELSALAERVGDSVGFLFSVVNTTFNGIFTIFTLFVLSFYLMIEHPRLHTKVLWFTKKPEHVLHAEQVLRSIEKQLGGWVRGELLLIMIIGVMTYMGLALLSIPFALPLAIMAGMLEIIPNIGPTVAAVPAVLIALVTYGPVMGGVVLLFSIVVQQLENNLIVPKIMSKHAAVSPLVTIVAILIGLKIGGVIGALLAVPVYIIVRTLYTAFFKQYIAE